MSVSLESRAKTSPDTSVEYLTLAEYHSQANQVQGETRAWDLKRLKEIRRKTEHRYRKEVHLADAAALDEDTAMLTYINSGINLMVKGEQVAQNYMKLKYVKNRTGVLKEKYQHQLGMSELPGLTEGESNLTFPGLDEGITLLAAATT